MKHVVVYLQGVAESEPRLGPARSALSTARAPTLRQWARSGRSGWLDTAGLGVAARRPELLLALFCGASPEAVRGAGVGGLEALGVGGLPPDRFWYRGDFVTMDGDRLRNAGLQDLTEAETRVLVEDLAEVWAAHDAVAFMTAPGQVVVGLRHEDGTWPAGVAPWTPGHPERLPGLRITETARRFASLQVALRERLQGHDINRVRVDLGEDPANAVWLWGGSLQPAPFPLAEGRRSAGCVWAATPLARGLAAGLRFATMTAALPGDKRSPSDVLSVARLTEALRACDTLLVPVDRPASSGLQEEALGVRSAYVDLCDRQVLAPLAAVLEAFRPYRLVLLADADLFSAEASARESLCLLLTGERVVPDFCAEWCELACHEGGLGSITLGPLLETFWEA